MALDVYVGSLTRYYSGNWETVGQAWAREAGVKYQRIRPEDMPFLRRLGIRILSIFDRRNNQSPRLSEVQLAVIAWRQTLTTSLPNKKLDWQESIDTPYFTDRPAWDGYAGLLLWAAYDEHPDMERPTLSNSNWIEDPAFRASTAQGFTSRYSHLLRSEFWLPAEFEYPFGGESLNGEQCIFGSSIELLRELEELSKRTWQADGQVLETQREHGNEDDHPLEVSAQFGFAVFHKLAELSVEHWLPMKLDY